MKLGELVKKYRQDHSLTVREFAVKCGVSHGYVAMLENGKNSKTGLPITPSLVTLNKIATGLGLTIDELIATVDDMPVTLQTVPDRSSDRTSDFKKALLELADYIPEEMQEHFLELTKAYAKNLKRD